MISILIPLYNGEEFLEQSVNSVINQTYKKWELIIGINGHYNDINYINKINTIINKLNYGQFNIIVNNYNTNGKAQTLNNMVKDSKYNFIALLDVDDIWTSDKLENQINYINDYDVVGTKCQYFGDINIIPTIPTGDISNFEIFSVNPIINSSVIIKKDYANWDEKNINEDYDLWFRLYYEKRKFYNIDKILCLHRIHKNSAFNNDNHKYVEQLKDNWRIIMNIRK